MFDNVSPTFIAHDTSLLFCKLLWAKYLIIEYTCKHKKMVWLQKPIGSHKLLKLETPCNGWYHQLFPSLSHCYKICKEHMLELELTYLKMNRIKYSFDVRLHIIRNIKSTSNLFGCSFLSPNFINHYFSPSNGNSIKTYNFTNCKIGLHFSVMQIVLSL